MSEYIVHEEEYKGLTIKILPDDDGSSMNPVEDWDMLGKQVYWHRRMNLGHCWEETGNSSPGEWLRSEVYAYAENSKQYKNWKNTDDDLSRAFRKDCNVNDWLEDNTTLEDLMELFSTKNLVIPVHAYEHGGITISCGRFFDSFDSGQLGFIYVSHEDILKEYGGKKITKKLLEQAEKTLRAEVEEYDDYLTGNVYGFCIEDEDGENLDSCWGFIGDYKYCLEEAKSNADFIAKKLKSEKRAAKLAEKKKLAELDRRMTMV